MGWLTGGLFVCCTASLVVWSDVALSDSQGARAIKARDVNERLLILLRRDLCFPNDTSVSEKSICTARTSAVPTDSAAVTPTETDLSSTADPKENDCLSKFPSPYSFSHTPLDTDTNVPPTSSVLYSSGVVSHGTSTTQVSITLPVISVLSTAATRVWTSEKLHPDLSEIASSINPVRTASSLVVKLDPKPSLGDSLVSPLLQGVVSSQTPGAQLPIVTSVVVYSPSDTLSVSLPSTTYPEAQQQSNEITSNGAPPPTTAHHADLLASESVFTPSSTSVISSLQKHHVNVPTEAISAFSNSGTALSTISNASKTATGLQQHLVSGLVKWAPLIASAADASRSSGTEVSTVTTATLTRTIPHQTASASEVGGNSFLVTTQALNNNSAASVLSIVRSEGNVVSAPWSFAFTWANSQTTTLSTPILSANSDIPTTSFVYTNRIFSGFVPTTSQTASPSSALAPNTDTCQGDSSFLLPRLSPSSVSGNEGVSVGASSDSSFQMTLQPASISTLITQTSEMFAPIQTVTPTLTAEPTDARYASSSIVSSATSPPCSSIYTSFIGWTNTSAYKPTGESSTSSQSTISTTLETNSSTNLLVLWYMSRTSSQRLYSTSTPPLVSKYMDVSSFLTRIKTPDSEPPSQTRMIANDIDTTITISPSTIPFRMQSPTETVVSTPSPPLTSSETVGVAIGSTAGLLLAIIAAIFVARRYYATRSAKHGSDGPYPELAYLYDPSLGCAESDNGRDDDTSTFMSGGVTGRPLTPTRNRTPPPPPHNSVDFGYCRLYSDDARYSDPGNPFIDAEDPFLEWRNSDAISTRSDTRFDLAAAVARYSNGPRKPLPPPPSSVSIHAIRDHVIPSPTLSPITNGYGLQSSLVRSSSRSSVKSQKSLKKVHCSPSSSSSSRVYGRGRGQSLNSIQETDRHRSVSDLMENGILLPVDTRSETSDSVVVYASTLTSKSLTQHSIPPSLTNNPGSTSICKNPDTTLGQDLNCHSRRGDPLNLNATQSYPCSSELSNINPAVTNISYADFPSPPSSVCTSAHKCWEEIEPTSTDYAILMSPISPVSPSSLSPTLPSPPPPLKKRSTGNLPQQTQVPSTVTTTYEPLSSPGHQFVPAPLRIKTRFPEHHGKGFERSRRSWLDKVQGIGEGARG